MNLPFIADKIFQKQDYRTQALQKAEYDNCTFINCDFTDSYLSYVSFTDCEFKDCNLSGIKIKDTTFKDVLFTHSKLLGVHFNDCSDFLFSINANHSIFSFSSFYNKNLNKATFNNCIMEKVDFTDANLSQVKFLNTDLKYAVFENCNLEKADFTSASNFIINPSKNNIKKAKFSKEGALNLLQDYQIIIE
jgi:uncharacterized protein YjbI with pentapeptide repeats